jgi:hypothetical protein
MDVCVVLDVWTIAWNTRWHAGQKGLKQYKWIKGENPGINTKKKSRLEHGCLSLVSIVCYQVEVSATSRSLVQRSPTKCGVSKKCVIVKPRKMRRPRPPRGCRAIGKKEKNECTACADVCNRCTTTKFIVVTGVFIFHHFLL